MYGKALHLIKRKIFLFEIALLFIITIPAFFSLLNNQYFSMHDDQHVARLYLLDQGIRQGNFFPRWVDGLGFGYGYPLFNFYPPLIYYIAEIFHLIGFPLFWSIKLVFITGFLLGSLGMYLFTRKFIGSLFSFLSTVLYTYFFYHAVTSYVRGALAEFFSMAILPFVFLTLDNLAENVTIKNSLLFAVTLALLILAHPLIAFPAVFYIAFFLFFYLFFLKDNRLRFVKHLTLGSLSGLALSVFFWLPSIFERKYTLIDNVLTKELANYKIHYIYLQQFWQSAWGYGGSIAGPNDGMTFQLGKVHIILLILSVLMSVLYVVRNRKLDIYAKYFFFFLLLLLFSLFMTTSYSSLIWNNVKYLWYLQFPWRFLTFTGFFLAIVAGFGIYFFKENLDIIHNRSYLRKAKIIFSIIVIAVITLVILRYQHYFTPQKFINTNDKKLTTYEEIAWRVSKTSFEFVPKGVKTKKTELQTTTLDINKDELPKSPFTLLKGSAKINIDKNKFSEKQFIVRADSPVTLQINTYNFPGWSAYIKDNKGTRSLEINDNNKLKLITLSLPKGNYNVSLVFKDTLIRTIGNLVSAISLSIVIILLRLKRVRK